MEVAAQKVSQLLYISYIYYVHTQKKKKCTKCMMYVAVQKD